MIKLKSYRAYLNTSMAIALGAVITGCVSLGPPPPSANYPDKIANVPVAKALPQGVKIDADDHFDDQHDLDNALEGSNKIVIPAFKVHLVISDIAEASVSGTESTSFGGLTTKTSGASASMRVHLSGLNDAQLQAIANAAYADLVAQLQAAGREVVSADDMRATLGYHSIEFAKPNGDSTIIEGGSFNSGDNRTYLDIPATGLPLWYIDFFNNNNGKSFNFLSSELKAVALIPTITVTFVKMESSGRGSAFFGGGTADVGAKLGIRLVNVEYNGTLAENAMGGDMGVYVLRQYHDDPIVVPGHFAKLTKSSSSKSGGIISNVVSKSDYIAKANPEKFSNLVLQGIQAANKAFVGFTKEHQP
jgi:hypothetical protein